MKQKKAPGKTLGLEYLEGAFTDEELRQFSDALENSGLAFISRSEKPRYVAGIEDLFPQIQVFLSNDIVQAIVLGLATNAVYDALKMFVKLIKKLSCNKPLTKIQNGKADTKAVPKIHFNIGSMHAVLPVEVDDKKYEYFIDKMFESVNAQTITKESYLIIDDTFDEVRLLAKEQIVTNTINKKAPGLVTISETGFPRSAIPDF